MTAAAFFILTSLLALVHFTETRPAPPVVSFTVPPPPGGTIGGSGFFHALSPDATKLAFVGSGSDGITRRWIRHLNSVEPQPIAGSEGAGFPFWSPDGRFIGFFAQGRLNKVDVGG